MTEVPNKVRSLNLKKKCKIKKAEYDNLYLYDYS